MSAIFRIFAMILIIFAAISLASAESPLPAPPQLDAWPVTEITADDSAAPAQSGLKTLKLTVWQNAPNDSAAEPDVIPYPNVKGVLFVNGQAVGTVTTNADGVAYLQNIDEGLAEFVAESAADNRFGSEECPVDYALGTLATLDFLLTDQGLVRLDAKNRTESDQAQNAENFDEFQPEAISQPMEYYPESGTYSDAGQQHYGRGIHRRHWGLLGLAGLAGLAGIEPVSPSSPNK